MFTVENERIIQTVKVARRILNRGNILAGGYAPLVQWRTSLRPAKKLFAASFALSMDRWLIPL